MQAVVHEQAVHCSAGALQGLALRQWWGEVVHEARMPREAHHEARMPLEAHHEVLWCQVGAPLGKLQLLEGPWESLCRGVGLWA